MPPRRKPKKSLISGAHSQVSGQLEPFLYYLEAECGMAVNTIRAYRTDLRQFLDWLRYQAVEAVDDVSLPVLGGYLEHLNERGLAPTSVARHIVSLKMFFRFLVLEGIVSESIVEQLNSPKLWRYLPTVLSPETVDRLLDAPKRQDRYYLRDRALLTVLYATGCRASEVTSLRLADLHLNEGFCRCIGKGNKERMVSLNPVARAALEAYLKHERPQMCRIRNDETVFVTRSGKALSRISVWNIVKKYAARIGSSKKVSPHTLRHSFATHMLAGGAEIRALQEMLGHASIRTTQVYTQVEHSRLKSIHAKCHPRG